MGGVALSKLVGQTIEMRHAAPRSLAGAGYIEGTVIQALRHLGPQNIDAATVKHLRQLLTGRGKSSLRREAFNAPGWFLSYCRSRGQRKSRDDPAS